MRILPRIRPLPHGRPAPFGRPAPGGPAPHGRPALALALALSGGFAAFPAATPAQAPGVAPVPAYAPSVPASRQLYRNGPDGRYLMDGPWLFRFGDGAFQYSSSTAGWQVIPGVPYAWNATDPTDAGFIGRVGWYRKDFKLPSRAAGLTWLVRFESANYRVEGFLNGHRIGKHAGEFLAFELELPARYLKRGVNRLTVRVDSRHAPSDLPPSSRTKLGTPGGGWWNYGGLLREVYLRRVKRVDFSSALVLPSVACPTCTAHVNYRVTMHNYSRNRQVVHLSSRYGGRSANLGTKSINPGSDAVFTKRLGVPHPALWSPLRPFLYRVTIDASAQANGSGSFAHVGHYFLQSGIRSLKVSSGGLLVLNGQPVHLRGVGLQEDSQQNGFAIDNATRARFVTETKDLGASMIRSQYPLHPYIEELADQQGIILWSEIPVFSVKEEVLITPSFRRVAEKTLQTNILTNGSHPSVGIWSIANELSSRPQKGQQLYIKEAAKLARGLDPTRPVGLALAGYPSVECQSSYGSLQVLGINDYFGWYPGPDGQIADRTLLSGYLDKAHACYPHKAVMVTEFGAEANRNGPVEERGTYQFQSDFVNYHLGVFDTKPWLAAAVYWALEEFRVRPGWDGGNPRPNPPVHEKGLVDLTGFKKPAYSEMQRIYRQTRQTG